MFRFLPAPTPWIVAAFAAALLTLAACASTPDASGDRDERVESQLASIDAAVDLTADQSDRIREILATQEASRPSGPPPQGGGQTGGADPRAQREAQRAATDRQIEAVLTEAQVASFRAWRADQPQRPQGPPPRGR